jgi:hypothetical protein
MIECFEYVGHGQSHALEKKEKKIISTCHAFYMLKISRII